LQPKSEINLFSLQLSDFIFYTFYSPLAEHLAGSHRTLWFHETFLGTPVKTTGLDHATISTTISGYTAH